MKFAQTLTLAAGLGLSVFASLATPAAAADTKIGFIVKQPEEPWFQDEWKFADRAGAEHGFDVVKIGATDGEQLLAAINNLAAQGAEGFVVCTPDVNLGPAIVATANAAGLKVMTVDDRLVDASGNAIESVPHMGISAYKIGQGVGEAIAGEIAARGWDVSKTGAIRVTYEQLPTAVDRVSGATEALVASGFPEDMIFDAPQTRTDTESALNAATIVMNQHPDIKHWVAYGLNDEAVLGAVRAAESAGIGADSVIGVGIGGAASAINEFNKPDATGFYGTIMISPLRHGYETALNMYNWVANDQEPEMLILTSGSLATRDDYKQVMNDLGIQ